MPVVLWERRSQTRSVGSRQGLPATLRLAIVVERPQRLKPQSGNAVIAALKRCATQNKLPLAVRVGRVIVPSDLITFVMHNENHANRHERGRDDKNQNPTAQGLNHSTTGGGRLGITERATLGEGRERGGKHGQSSQPNSNKEEGLLDLHLS